VAADGMCVESLVMGARMTRTKAPSTIEPRLMNVEQAARYLACSVHAIRQLQWSSAIPSLKIGKRIQFDRADLDRYVDAQKTRVR
jgi:excisionase family DNA binding protein